MVALHLRHVKIYTDKNECGKSDWFGFTVNRGRKREWKALCGISKLQFHLWKHTIVAIRNSIHLRHRAITGEMQIKTKIMRIGNCDNPCVVYKTDRPPDCTYSNALHANQRCSFISLPNVGATLIVTVFSFFFFLFLQNVTFTFILLWPVWNRRHNQIDCMRNVFAFSFRQSFALQPNVLTHRGMFGTRLKWRGERKRMKKTIWFLGIPFKRL